MKNGTRWIGFLLLALTTTGCGVLLARNTRSTGEVVVSRGEARHSHVATAFRPSAELTFRAEDASGVLSVRLAREDRCLRYVDVAYFERSEEGIAPEPAGVALDAGVFAAGLAAAFLLDSAPARAGVVVGAAIPLGMDLFLSTRRTTVDGAEMTRREADPASDTDEDGYYACAVEADPPYLTFAGVTTGPSSEGEYLFRLSEADLWGRAEGDELRLALKVSSAAAREVTAETALPPEWAQYAAARRDAMRGGLVEKVRFVTAHGQTESALAESDAVLSAIAEEDNEDLLVDAYAAAEGHAELRGALGRRIAELRRNRLADEIPALLEVAWRAAEGERIYSSRELAASAAVEKRRFTESMAEACERFADLRDVVAGDLSPLHRTWRRRLTASLGEAGAREALTWLLTCETTGD